MKDGLTEIQKIIDQKVQKQLPSVYELPEPDRSKSLVCLAYEYFIQDLELKAFELLEQADPKYFQQEMFTDLKDPKMNKIFMTIVAKLIEIGYVNVEETGKDVEEE